VVQKWVCPVKNGVNDDKSAEIEYLTEGEFRLVHDYREPERVPIKEIVAKAVKAWFFSNFPNFQISKFSKFPNFIIFPLCKFSNFWKFSPNKNSNG